MLKLTGALAFAQGDPQSQQATQEAATGMQAFRFPVTVGTPAPTMFQAASSLRDHHDAFDVPFSASDRATTDSVIESGATAGESSIPIALQGGRLVRLRWRTRSFRSSPFRRSV